MAEIEEKDPLKIARGRRQLLAVVLLFAAPIVLACVLVGLGWRPVAAKNYGRLIEPARDFRSVPVSGTPAPAWGDASGHWHALALMPPACTESCVTMMDSLRRVWLGLGRHAQRVRVWYVGTPDAQGQRALQVFPQAAALRLDPGALPPAAAEQPAALLPFDVYLVDPHGYLVLHYPAGSDPIGLRKDLRRLLR